MSAPDISVVIPTLNRAASLRRMLETLAAQGTGGAFTYEVVVVDNGSTDDTRGTVEHMSRTFPVPLRCVTEPRRGRPIALNTGFRHALGTLFVITDDDLEVTPAWLQGFWRCFQEERPDGVAGRVLPRWVDGLPAWLGPEALRDLNRLGLGCLDHGEQRLNSREKRYCRWVGGNMGITCKAVQRVGGFDERMVRGQDFEFYERCIERGLTVCYEPSALAFHKVGPERLTPKALRRWRDRQGYYDAYLLPWRTLDLLTIMPLWWYRKLFSAVGTWLRAMLTAGPWWLRFRAELVLRQHVGILRHRVALWPRWWMTVVTGRPHLPAALGTDAFGVTASQATTRGDADIRSQIRSV